MAKKTDTNTTEKTFNAVAKQFIKYDGEHLKAGDKFQVKESDVEELKVYAEIEIPKEEPPVDPNNGQGNQQGENGGQ